MQPASSDHLTDNQIAAFLSGGLSAEGIESLEAHVDQCAECRALLSASARDTATPGGASSLALTRQLTEGQVIADRYRIVRFIGAGGMGEVYEVHDTVLNVRVALKTVHQERTDDPDAIDRLRRELTLARQVTHPNVSRVFDVGEHRAAGAEPLAFFTLELLTGETIAERLARAGRFSAAEARPILEQIAHGLDAAHAVGVLHRDLKSHNVFLRRSESGATQAVLTDFGLARSSRPEAGTQSGSGAMMGTPAYMAPEQVSGAAVGPAADLYAFGVVAFEMVTGRLPFQASHHLATASLRLTEDAPDPRSVVGELTPQWSRFIGSLLQRSPADRPKTATAAMALLWSPPSPPRAKLLVAVIAMAAVAGLVAAAMQLRRAPTVAPATVEIDSGRRRVIAVLPPKNISAADADAAWLPIAVGQMVSAELTASPQLRSVEPDQLAQTEADLSLGNLAELSPGQLDALKKSLDLDLVLSGALTVVGKGDDRTLRLDLRLYDAGLGRQLAVVTESGPEKDLFAMVHRASEKFRESLRQPSVSAADSAAARASLPASLEVERTYAEGLRALHTLDLVRARSLLQATIAAEPDFGPAHAAYAQTLLALGRREEAIPVAKHAVELSGSLPREQKLTIEALYAATSKDWPRAIELYRSLSNVFPDDFEHGLHLATAQLGGGRLTDGLATLEQLRHRPGPEHDDPRVELAASWLQIRVPDFVAAEKSAAIAAVQAGVRNTRVLQARARLSQAEALLFQSRRDEALPLLDEAVTLFHTVGDLSSEAKSKVPRGHIYRDRGQMDEALQQYREAEAIDRALDDERNLSTALSSQATIYRRKGNPAEALRLNEEALALIQKNGDPSSAVVMINNIGRALEDLGRPEEAEKRYEETIALCEQIGENGLRVRALGSLGLLAADRGDLAKGQKAFEDILSAIQKMGDAVLETQALDELIFLQLARGDVVGAEARLTQHQTLSTQKKLEDEVELKVARAQIALAKRQYAQAETLAREAAEAWRARKSGGDEVETRQLVFEASLRQKNKAGAAAELARVQDIAAGDLKSPANGFFTRMHARFEAELGDARQGVAELSKLLQGKPLKASWFYELSLSLVRGEARAGNRAAAMTRLADVLKDARAQGFGSVVAEGEQLYRDLKVSGERH